METPATPGPVGAGVILVRQTPEGAFAWATASTVTHRPAAGTSAEEVVAYLAALEAFLDHPAHTGRHLTLDVEDIPASSVVVRLIAEHLPHIPVTTRSDLHTQEDDVLSSVLDALPPRKTSSS